MENVTMDSVFNVLNIETTTKYHSKSGKYHHCLVQVPSMHIIIHLLGQRLFSLVHSKLLEGDANNTVASGLVGSIDQPSSWPTQENPALECHTQ